ncbi:MAG: diaminopimelate dehydrogenase [Dehalococcoidales bacterium]|nr:MAG: diaminopimelate dehydrogenase [Dehalococcoidales bacterium]
MINVAIVGYGNLGHGVRTSVERNPDMELVAIFTRRPAQVQEEVRGTPVLDSQEDVATTDVQIDVVILCGGSKEDTPVQGPLFIRRFNTVDSFDTHADIPDYFNRMDDVAREFGNVAVISAGWDPGIFSLERVIGDAFLPVSKGYTFWGSGVSQGHSDAARKVSGVVDARQYTIPLESAIEQVREGTTPGFSKREMHKRVVYVIAEDDSEQDRIRREIAEMPNYFAEYDTEVIFITGEEMQRDHAAYPHGGFVLTSGQTGKDNRQILEYKCQLESNPEFTGSILVACARAAFRLKQSGQKGAFTMLDIPPALLSQHSGDVLRSSFM